ncbi:MAG: alkaline phosphatase family protein [Gaiellales bacterium]
MGLLPQLRQRVRAAIPAVRQRAAGRRPDGAAPGGGGHGRIPVGRCLSARGELPGLRRGHPVGRSKQLPQREGVLRPHPPAGQVRRSRRPALPRLEPGRSDHAVREREWEQEFRGFLRNGGLPGLEVVYLPNDHTQGTTPGTATPASYMADNDVALGRLVDAVSHSRYWRSTAIFVVEDDAQDGPDHVDAHRSPALVISPYTQHGAVDSTHYDTAGVLATIEDLLGMGLMSIFDQRATRLWRAFSGPPNMAPYNTIQPTVIPFGDPGYPRNGRGAPLASLSAAQDFSVPDGPDEHLLNEAIWRSIRGAHSHMPRPHDH